MASQKQLSDVLVIGELNMDLILNGVASFPELGKEKIAKEMSLTLGSSSAIFAANIARLGLSVDFCGMVGNDDFGKNTIKRLNQYNVNTSWISHSKHYNTGLTTIIQQSDDRAMLTFPGCMEHFSLSNIPDEAFQQARHLHISSIFLQPGIKNDLPEIIGKAKSQGMTISIDPQWDPDEKWDLDLEYLLPKIDFFIPNEAEFLQFTNSDALKEGFQKLPRKNIDSVIVKTGKNGAAIWSDENISIIPAFRNDHPVDKVGAGDSFDAGFIYRFLRGNSIEECIRFGNLTGAVSTTKQGGTAAITSLDEVLRIANERFSSNEFNE